MACVQPGSKSCVLKCPKLLPRGTPIECSAVFDNSPNNPFNPDPTATVSWGPQSADEMMIGWLDFAVECGAAREGAGVPVPERP